jgi:hypothetical protein
MDWQPLSVREGVSSSRGPYEGVPPHLAPELIRWLQGVFGYTISGGMGYKTMLSVVTRSRIAVPPVQTTPSHLMNAILNVCLNDDERFLDVVDAALYEQRWGKEGNVVRKMLEVAGSAWTVSVDGASLHRRVDPAAQVSMELATTPNDVASAELTEAWAKAYGRSPNASDAWDHSIKAVEAALIPVVVPKQDKPQLGHVLGQLDRNESQWKLGLTSQQGLTPVQTLVGMLRLVWPNPDRHPAGDRREPSLEEAQAVVHLAVTIVQWTRGELLKGV